MSQRSLSQDSETGVVGVVLAVDAGTTGVTVLLVTDEADVLARGYAEFAQHFPHHGWVEHAPEQIWQAPLPATHAALHSAPRPPLGAGGSTHPTRAPLPAARWSRAAIDRAGPPGEGIPGRFIERAGRLRPARRLRMIPSFLAPAPLGVRRAVSVLMAPAAEWWRRGDSNS